MGVEASNQGFGAGPLGAGGGWGGGEAPKDGGSTIMESEMTKKSHSGPKKHHFGPIWVQRLNFHNDGSQWWTGRIGVWCRAFGCWGGVEPNHGFISIMGSEMIKKSHSGHKKHHFWSIWG